MSGSLSLSADETFFLENIQDFIDGKLQTTDEEKFQNLINQEEFKEKFSKFKTNKGQLQVGLQGQFLNEGETLRIRGFVQNHNQLDEEENKQIDEIERTNTFTTWSRRLFFLGLLAATIIYVIQNIMPEFEEKFDALRYLGYEAIALDQDPETRLDLKNIDDTDLISQYLQRYPGLSFKPVNLKQFSKTWTAAGASILDYDYIKVSVVQYRRPFPNQKVIVTETEDEEDFEEGELQAWQYQYLYHFSLPGERASFDLSQPDKIGDLTYYTFSSEDHNFVLWKSDSGIYSLLAGKESAATLAKYAQIGTN